MMDDETAAGVPVAPISPPPAPPPAPPTPPPAGAAPDPAAQVKHYGRVFYVPTPEERERRETLAIELDVATRKKVEALWSNRGYRSWEEWLKSVAEIVIDFVDDETYVEMNTAEGLLPVWARNMAENLRTFGQYDDAALPRDVEDLAAAARGKDAIIVGAGPSVGRRQSLSRLARHIGERGRDGLYIVATDKMLERCYGHGLRPDLVAGVDSDAVVSKFYEGQSLRDLNVALSVTTHPDVVRLALAEGARVYMSVPFIDPDHVENVLFAMWHLFGGRYSVVDACGNTGSHCWQLARIAGARRIALVGFDMGYHKDQRLEATPYGRKVREMFTRDGKVDEAKVEKFFTHFEHACWGKREKYLTDVVFRGYARGFLAALRHATEVETFNCTEGGVLCGKFGGEGHPLRCVTLEEFLAGGV